MSDEEKTLGYLVHDVARLWRKRFDQRAREHRLSLAQCKCLAYIRMNEGIHQCDLADLMEIEPISLARLVDRMAAAGWIERQPDPADRRAWRLFLTDQGRCIFETFRPISNEIRELGLATLSAGEIEQLMELLGRVHANLTEPSVATPARKPEQAPGLKAS